MRRPGQTQQPTTIKIVMHIPEGIPYGHFLENLELSNPPSRKIALFCEFGLTKITANRQKKFGTTPRPNRTAYNDKNWHAPS